MNNGSHQFIDEGKESAVVGTISTGFFDRIPESKLIPVKAFTGRRCQIPYGAAFSLRKAGIPVCLERVSDLIERQGLGDELQRLLDSSNTFPWRDTWQDFFDQSFALCPSTTSVEYSLEVLASFTRSARPRRLPNTFNQESCRQSQPLRHCVKFRLRHDHCRH